MRVSVIVPLYNSAPHIRRCLDSIAAQSFPDFEAIVVDDGSTDGGADAVLRYPDPRFRLIRQANAGPGAARNRAIAEARGELLAFLDADDAWLPEYLESSLLLLDQHGPAVAAVTSGYVEYPAGVSREPMWRARGVTDGVHRVTPRTPPLCLVHMLAYMSPCTTVARAEAVRRWGGFHQRNRCCYAEDASLWLKVLMHETVCFQFRPLVNVHRETSGLSGNLLRPRPVEPFLLDPGEIAQVCPPELRSLLDRFYAIRACKTAAVLGYWGQWREAARLFRRFVSWRDWRVPFFASALVGCTPLGALSGWIWRRGLRLGQPYARL